MQSVEEMAEFVKLWDMVQEVQLTAVEDEIIWKFTADGQYTAESAYKVQFRGSYCSFNSQRVWRAHVEPKHKFFTWLLVQEKILAADRMQQRQWPCDPLCQLCRQQPETATHLCLQCPFAQHVWEHVQAWTSSHVKKPSDTMRMEEWWTQEVQLPTKEERRTCAAINMYTVWNLWKERNRRIFEGKEADPVTVFQFMREEMGLRAQACGTPVNFIS